MERAKLNALVDISSLLTFLVSSVSGLVVYLVLLGEGRFLGTARHSWTYLHEISSLLFIVLMVLHFILHLGWYRNLMKIIKS